jgi:exonuclease VII large subunit
MCFLSPGIWFSRQGSGAALKDIVTVTRKRWPAVRLIVINARVQGETAG